MRGNDIKLYHQTNKANLNSIFQKGLIPNNIGIVYLTPLLNLGFGEITLEVETGNNKLTAFEDCSNWEVLCWGPIPPENIKLLKGNDMAVNTQQLQKDYDEARFEIYRLKELLCTIKNVSIVDFDSTIILLTLKGIDKDFRIPESRFEEILKSL